MKFTRFEKPAAIEELVIEVQPGRIDDYIAADNEIWTKFLETSPAFLGKEIWRSTQNENQVTVVIYWSDKAIWDAIPAQCEVDTDEKMFVRLGGRDVFKIVEQKNRDDQKYRVAEYK